LNGIALERLTENRFDPNAGGKTDDGASCANRWIGESARDGVLQDDQVRQGQTGRVWYVFVVVSQSERLARKRLGLNLAFARLERA